MGPKSHRFPTEDPSPPYTLRLNMKRMEPLDVLVIESHDGTGQRHAAALATAGHRVRRCSSPGANAFPCAAIIDAGSCPVDHGVDVALLVRRNVALRPSDREQGVSCAIRAGVPVVEDGPAVLDPFEPYVTSRVTGDLVESCEEAAVRGYDELRSTILERCALVLTAAGVSEDALDITFRRNGTRLLVEVCGEQISKSLQDSLAVKVVAAITEGTRSFDGVDVSYRARTPERAERHRFGSLSPTVDHRMALPERPAAP